MGGFVINQFLQLVLNRLSKDTSSSPTDSGQGLVQQGTESPEFGEVKDELIKEIEELLGEQTDAPTEALTANAHQASLAILTCYIQPTITVPACSHARILMRPLR